MLNILIIFQMYSDFAKEFSSFMNALTHVKHISPRKESERVRDGMKIVCVKETIKWKSRRTHFQSLSLSQPTHRYETVYSLLALVLSVSRVCTNQRCYYYSSFALKSISRTNVFLQLNFEFNTLSFINSWLLFCISSIFYIIFFSFFLSIFLDLFLLRPPPLLLMPLPSVFFRFPFLTIAICFTFRWSLFPFRSDSFNFGRGLIRLNVCLFASFAFCWFVFLRFGLRSAFTLSSLRSLDA